MSILPIVSYGAEVLRRRAQPVTEIDQEVQRLIEDMADTMFAAPGVGLAAPQVGVSRRIIVVRSLEDPEGKEYFALINPEIVEAEGEETAEEGCLSVPELSEQVGRATKVKVRALDRDGRPVEVEGEGLMARILQHEIDHLDGLLYLDRLSPVKRDLLKRKLKKMVRQVR